MPDHKADASGDASAHAGERRFRTALSSMVDPVAVVSAVTAERGRKRGEVVDFVVNYANDRPGTPRVGTKVSSLWPKRDHKRLLAIYRQLLEEGGDLVFDALRLPGLDGGDRFLDLRAARLDDSEIIATWRDVTDRVRADEALAQSEALLRGAFDDAPVGALLISVDETEADGGRLLKVNRAFAALVGYRQQQLLGMPLRALLHPDDLMTARSPVELLERPGEPIRLRRSDGSSVWVRLTSGEVAPRITSGRDGSLVRPAYLVIHAEDVTSRRQIEQELADRHLHDPLTGLANRHLLLDRFRLAVDNLDRHPGAIVVLHIDLDRFKDVNDTYGHSVGDQVLAEVGRRLGGLVDSPDTAARLAGDEFVIVTAARRRSTAAVTGAATRLAEEVTEVLGEAIRLPEHDDLTLQLGVSIGIAVTTSPDSEPEQLLLQADRAMFEAKRRGRHRYEVFRQGLSHTAPERLKVEQEVRDAVANGWLRLYYQPVIDLTTGRLGGAEALLRIEHPERGLLKPGAFIDIVEDSDLILPIGDWVLEEACRQLQLWQRIPGLSDFSMAVNVSGRQASDSALTARALDAVKSHNVDPRRLCLEMTERVLIDADESVVKDLRALTAKGVQIALDDFGTGYASLSYLQRFPVSTLKIDRSFVTGVGVTATDTAIVASIVALAHALNLDVVAEGVETAEQLAQLRSHHCAKAQGFFFAPPLEADIFGKALQKQAEKTLSN